MNLISKKADIGKNVNICPTTIVYDNVIIGDNAIIESYCILGMPSRNDTRNPLIIGENSHIRSHSVFYDNSQFGQNLVTGHHILLRDKITAGKYFQIGSYTELEGDSTCGNYVKLHSKVHLSLKSKIGHFVWLFPRAQTSTDPLPPSDIEKPITIKDMAVVAINSLILPGVTIGIGSYVSAGSIVKNDVPDAYCVTGNPAEVFTRIDRLIDFQHKIRHPWPLHYKTRYPKESYELMDKIVKKIENIVKDK